MPPGRPPRVAYLVSAYQEGTSLLRLVAALQAGDPDSPIVVHHNVFAGRLDDEAARTLRARGVHVHEADEPIVWGDYTLEAARRHELRWMTDHLDFDWVVLLSEQDYPIRPTREFAAHVAACGADALLDAVPIAELDGGLAREMRRRYLYRYAPAPRLLQLAPGDSALAERVRGVQRAATGLLNRISTRHQLYHLSVRGRPSLLGRRPDPSPFAVTGLTCWYGSAWFAMSARAARAMLDALDARPDVVRHYERTVIPTESEMITVLANDPSLTVRREAIHVIHWTDPTSGRPDVLLLDDLDELLASGKFFARKVDAHAHPDLLDALDEHLADADGVADRSSSAE